MLIFYPAFLRRTEGRTKRLKKEATMVRILNKYNRIDYVKVELLQYFITIGYVIAVLS